MAKIMDLREAVNLIEDGMTLMIGGFMSVGIPQGILSAMVLKGLKSLTVISNDTGQPGIGLGQLVRYQMIKELWVSHIGTNPETGKSMNESTLRVNLVPQGSLVEKIRCGGAGLGGVLTPTGLGTPAALDKKIISLNGQDYLLETPLRANVAIIKAKRADRAGNLCYYGTARNFNPIMATAADLVIAEVDEIVDGYLNPDEVITPGLLVDILVKGGTTDG